MATHSLTDFSRPKLSPDFKQSKNSYICVKFGTHVLWHNTHDAFLLFFRISVSLFFELFYLFGGLKWAKFSPDLKQPKNGYICVKFGTHVLWHNTQDAYSFFFEFWFRSFFINFNFWRVTFSNFLFSIGLRWNSVCMFIHWLPSSIRFVFEHS